MWYESLSKKFSTRAEESTNREDKTLWLDIAIERGYAPSFHTFGKLLEEEDDNKEAFKWYEKAVGSGHYESYVFLSSCLSRGKFIDKDVEKAKKMNVKYLEAVCRNLELFKQNPLSLQEMMAAPCHASLPSDYVSSFYPVLS